MKHLILILIGIAVIATLLIVSGCFYTVDETEQVILTQFGKPVGDPITDAGLKFKTPFVQHVNYIEKRVLAFDGRSNEMPTKDKLFILVDTFARWRISDPARYFVALRDERSARSRLEDILGGETRNAVAKHDLIEMIRTTKDREVTIPEEIADFDSVSVLEPIAKGRSEIEREIYENAHGKLADLGLDLLDIRFKRINYNRDVRARIYDRMISERQQIAERFRSEGAGEAARILGTKEREVKRIQSEAYKEIQSIKGKADAEATEIYARAYNRSAESVDFYEFVKTMETYQEVLSRDTTVILSTDSDLFRFLKSMEGAGPASLP